MWKATLEWRNLANTTSGMWSKLTFDVIKVTSVVSHGDSMYHSYVWQRHFASVAIFQKTFYPRLNIRKAPDEPRLRDILQNICPVFLRIVQAVKYKDSLRNCHRPEDTKETWWLNVIYPWDRILGQKRDLREKLVTSEWSVKFRPGECWLLSCDRCAVVM